MTSPVSLAFSVRAALMTVSERPNADRYSQPASLRVAASQESASFLVHHFSLHSSFP